MPANDDTGFRPLTEEEKENFTGSWRCPKCGLPMFLACIEPAVEVDCERRTFACSTCPYGETITVNFRIDRGDAVSLERARPWWDGSAWPLLPRLLERTLGEAQS